MQRLARLSLGNRALVALVTAMIAILGVYSAGALKQELIPSLQLPAAAVVTVYPGASSEVVEENVTELVESAVLGVSGVSDLNSTSSSSLSVVTAEFTYGSDVERISGRISTALEQVRSQLPDDLNPQVITGSIDDLPVLQLSLAIAPGSEASDETLNTAADTIVAPRLGDVEGVRSVAVTGESTTEVDITLDPAALFASGVEVSAVSDVLENNGVIIPAGTITEGEQTFSVQIGERVTSLEELRAIPLISESGEPVPLDDVAEVELVSPDATSASRLDGEDAVAISVTKVPDANTVEVSHAVQEVIDDLEPVLTEQGLTIAIVFDQAPFIEESIEGLATEGLLGLVFAVLVIFLFLRSGRPTLVAAISIPLSLMSTFIVMEVVGYTLNILTLGAITVAIGRVVDDSIVVIENIQRHLSYGEERMSAIITAVREVGGAISSSTIATVAVFLPIGLTTGMVGELFRPFAMTVAIAMLASLVVALTIVPVLAYWFVRAPKDAAGQDPAGGAEGDEREARIARVRDAAEAKERRSPWQRAYLPTLSSAIRHPALTMSVAVLLLVGTAGLATRLETNFLGDTGQDTLTVTETFSSGTSFEAQDAAAREVEEILSGIEGVATVQSTVGSGSGEMAAFSGSSAPTASFSITLDGESPASETEAEIRDALDSQTDAERVETLTISGGDAAFGSSTVDLVVRSADSAQLEAAAAEVAAGAAQVDGATDVVSNVAQAVEVIQVVPDRDLIAAAGLTETQVAGVIAAQASPGSIGEVDLGAGPIPVRLVTAPSPQTQEELAALELQGATGPVPLSDIADIEIAEVPTSITRVNGERSATVSVTPAGQDLGALTANLTAMVEDLDLPAGVSVEVGGVAADQEEAFADLGLALLAAIAIVFIVMVATFNSLAQPLILLVSVPFAATGALAALLLTGTPLGVPSLIGLLMLIGIVVSNAIVLIDLINQYRARGRSLSDAVMEGSRKRLRPIIMTAAATIFALTPMAFGITGGGAFISQPLALVVIGGLISSTLLTLIVVPVLYTLLERGKERRAAKRAAKRGEGAGSDGAGESADSAGPTGAGARHVGKHVAPDTAAEH
ncbi:efflux RND transporter permease subunit [Serinibacter salmoneus]|uniref:HAE1 family hydrophobic/amphiphilic exporter-1 n=1 Tax=Serinibacter salmoneus TaxID=556530 RepID=A0A2A9CXJ3_9MICO|nr:efflux RND transporter permease subunit [Serinibacter salmoneus]PFG19123.1 HAE1 family hydrophobic/amphiphilic exporter-1 [Serinibacter salmoneus]